MRDAVDQIRLALCRKCRQRVPAHHEIRDGRVYLCKDCEACGRTEFLVSSDAASWQQKRDLWGYDPKESVSCRIDCERCGIPHAPTIAFVDVTNRCNMNCPICIANIGGMGFEFHPPLAYFEKVFEALGRMDPVPLVQLFGGEPTVRDDLLEIISAARRNGVKCRVVTNGLRLANEDYCRKLCDAGVRFQLALDGRSPEIYNRLRKNPGACEKKLKALENLKRFSRRKSAILCCAARNVNEDWIGDLVECCHEYADVIDSLGLLPLTETWDEGTFETDVYTTREDVEHMVERSVPGGQVEFIPAGVMHSFRPARSFFKNKSSSDALMFGGVHPDCETMTVLASDGRRYVSINQFLRKPLSWVAREILERGRRVNPRLSQLDPSKRWDRLRGKWIALRTFLPPALRAVDLRKVFRGNPVVVLLKMLGGVLRGSKMSDLARRHLNLSRLLRVATLPFEEFHSIDAARLQNCKAVFVYEDVADGRIKTVPACTWGSVYRNDILRKVSAKYNRSSLPAGEYAPTQAGGSPTQTRAAKMP
ncbi:MAG TPA: radical SAM protein [Phycisphaerae bacterium]|nr:radical SAM protein [Phycisphaerae bacterium]